MPSADTVDKALAAIKQPAAYEYFFDQLNSPAWIRPLLDRGFFRHPPAGQAEGDFVRFPIWPESRYLARMASRDPELVLGVLQIIPDTENPRVVTDMLDALLDMPPNVSRNLGSRTTKWVDLPHFNTAADKLGKLAVRFAEAGYEFDANALARALLTPVPDTGPVTSDRAWSITDAKPRYDMWMYQQVAEAMVPRLTELYPEATIRLLSEILELAVNFTVPEAEPPEDISWSWRDTIEESDQNSPVKRVTDVLVDALRTGSTTFVASMPGSLRDVVSTFDEHSWYIFRRLTYDLLASYPSEGLSLARGYVLDQANFDNVTVYHEFWRMTRTVYALLKPNEQRQVISGIEAGPRETHGDDPRRYTEIWIARRLAVLKDVLSGSALRRYRGLVADLGFEPEHPDLLIYTGAGFVGPTSPMQQAELEEMSVQDLVAFLQSWRSTDEFMGPSPEGLARSLASAAAARPRHYADAAGDLIDVGPTYVRGIIDGWTEAVRAGRSFDWAPVLGFCMRVVESSGNYNRVIEAVGTRDQWQWARRSITYLLSGGFGQGDCEIPAYMRSRVWDVLEPLTRDVEPTREFEAQYGGANMDPPSLAINTTRGQAMHDVIRYALWVARLTVESKEGAEFPIGFEALPEVRKVLDDHLIIELEPSPAVRSVYGQWLLWLYWLDPSWLQQRMMLIFPRKKQLLTLWEAAWRAYLMFNPVDDELFRLLRPHYFRAISRIGIESEAASISARSPEAGVGHHLLVQYLRDRLQLTDRLLVRFFENAGTDLRRDTLSYVGRVIGELTERVPGVVGRARDLWNMRRADGDAGELRAFGWWFITPAFEAAWAIRQLAETLRITQGEVDHEHGVLERLAAIADSEPRQAVICLRLMASADRHGLIQFGSFDKVQTILGIALSADQAGARKDAVDLVHWLGARGYTGLRSLL